MFADGCEPLDPSGSGTESGRGLWVPNPVGGIRAKEGEVAIAAWQGCADSMFEPSISISLRRKFCKESLVLLHRCSDPSSLEWTDHRLQEPILPLGAGIDISLAQLVAQAWATEAAIPGFTLLCDWRKGTRQSWWCPCSKLFPFPKTVERRLANGGRTT